MAHYDVFNGDADGICALQQLRLADPRAAVLVTGVKRDIGLLERVPAQGGDTVTVLDVSLHRNRAALERLLARDVAVEYFDHHFAGEVPAHPLLRAHLDGAPGTCTSLLVDRHLEGRHRAWAIVGAFGDNLPAVAGALGRAQGNTPDELRALQALGEAINYNAYADPLAFAMQEPVAGALMARKDADLAQALAIAPWRQLPGASVLVLPDAGWARRAQGVLGNLLSQRDPTRAHAVLRETDRGTYIVSVRAPQRRPRGADALCLRFPTGGGRASAGGIDALPRGDLDALVAALAQAWPAPAE
jgi:hypothetical protein